MTTGIYKKGAFVIADKRATGGHIGLSDTSNKINVVVIDDDLTIIVVMSGNKLLPGIIESLVRKYFTDISKKADKDVNLYKFKDDLKNYSTEFEGFIVFYETIPGTNGMRHDYGYRIIPTNAEEIIDFISVGSGGYLADGIFLLDPNTSPERYIELISTKDCGTSSVYDLIKLS